MTFDPSKIRDARNRLDAADTEIAGRIEAIEAGLRRLVNVRIETPIDADADLAFGKLGGTWRLIVVSGPDDAADETPLLSCPRQLRADVVGGGALERLIRDAAGQIDAMIEERKRAIERAVQLLDALDAAKAASDVG